MNNNKEIYKIVVYGIVNVYAKCVVFVCAMYMWSESPFRTFFYNPPHPEPPPHMLSAPLHHEVLYLRVVCDHPTENYYHELSIPHPNQNSSQHTKTP
jgi:hypothetical protein